MTGFTYYEKKTDKPIFLNYIYVMLNPEISGNYIYGKYDFKYEPFYVGKGSYDRPCHHFTKSSLAKKSPKNNKIKYLLSNNIKLIIIIIKDNLPNLKAHKLENNLIKLIGRKDLNEGVLLNRLGGKKQNL